LRIFNLLVDLPIILSRRPAIRVTRGIMKRCLSAMAVVLLCGTPLLLADTVVLRDGDSYTGRYKGAEAVTFSDSQGIKYQFPLQDVQSLAFSTVSDTVTLRNGKIYSGHFTGATPIAFQDRQGIQYQFPTSDLDAIIFNSAGAPAAAPANSLVIPIGADLPVRTVDAIDSNNSYDGQTYAATITEDVHDTAGSVAIPAGSSAKLLIRKIDRGGAVHSSELVLDLYSITVGSKEYRVVTTDVDESNKAGFGKNKRTAEFLGGGSALGALMGGIFGGGKGAGIGALAGAGGGFVTQAFTRGREVKVPSESLLRFRLDKTLILRPA
jgi:hypothetical protein